MLVGIIIFIHLSCSSFREYIKLKEQRVLYFRDISLLRLPRVNVGSIVLHQVLTDDK